MKGAYLPEGELRRMTQDERLCYASAAIVLEGRLVGYMVREAPGFSADSGWRFFAGGETAGQLHGPGSDFYPLNTLCNYDPDILPLLGAPVGAAFVRGPTGLVDIRSAGRETGDKKLAVPDKKHTAQKAVLRRRAAAPHVKARPVKIRDLRGGRPPARGPAAHGTTRGKRRRASALPAARRDV